MINNWRPAVLVCDQEKRRIDLEWPPPLDGDGAGWGPSGREYYFPLDLPDGRHLAVYLLGGVPREQDGALVFRCCTAGEDHAA